MRISDWSSDVCSSDLGREAAPEVDGIAETELPGGPREDLPGASAGPVGVYRLVQGHLDAGGAAPAGKACRDHLGVVGYQQVPRAQEIRQIGDASIRQARRASRCTDVRSEEHTSELQSLMRISYAVFCLNKKNITKSKKKH